MGRANSESTRVQVDFKQISVATEHGESRTVVRLRDLQEIQNRTASPARNGKTIAVGGASGSKG
jgi:hypothetical protein